MVRSLRAVATSRPNPLELTPGNDERGLLPPLALELWRRGDLNPGPAALQRKLLRVYPLFFGRLRSRDPFVLFALSAPGGQGSQKTNRQ